MKSTHQSLVLGEMTSSGLLSCDLSDRNLPLLLLSPRSSLIPRNVSKEDLLVFLDHIRVIWRVRDDIDGDGVGRRDRLVSLKKGSKTSVFGFKKDDEVKKKRLILTRNI